MKKNLVFDLAGVIFHWQPHELLRRVLSHRVLDEAAAIRLAKDFFQGYGGDWAKFDRGTIEEADLVPRIAARLGFELHEVKAVIDAVPGELQPEDEGIELLNDLHARGHRLFYLSNMPAPYARHLETTHKFFSCFGDGVFSSRVKLLKPQLEIYQLAQQQFKVDPARTVFIDDVYVNVDAARQLGWHGIQFLNVGQCKADLLAWLD